MMIIQKTTQTINKSIKMMINKQIYPWRCLFISKINQFSDEKKFINYYQVLGVQQNANQEEIKKIYNKFAKQYNDNKQPKRQYEQKFIEINEAYNVLTNQSLKKVYDENLKKHTQNLEEDTKEDFGFGPYKSQNFDNKKADDYYNYTQPQWARIRRGIRPQSMTSYYSQLTQNLGAQSDEALYIFKGKKNFLDAQKEQKKKQWLQKNKQQHLKLIQSNKKKHLQRLNTMRENQRKQIINQMNKKWYYRGILNLFGKIWPSKFRDFDQKN